ncbi:MAG TPA: TRCF domain-containing protein, partial [Dehalococcoidales bacterium]|nr:TRCF domain-containing protein [Dehalococcoidales bacterium]
PETELERVMADFTQGRSDVLVCTTIIQSGLDMPNVNTLIVNKADKFGLTELYQLRGRVGRGANLAYAYFLYEREKRLTPTARKRLKTIFAATELGSGFGIAMKDLEIRGAGNLLGVRQSGFINAVGFSLYCQLLAEAVDELKAKRAGVPRVKERRPPPPSVDLPLPAFIPDEYVADLNTRLSLYRRLSKLEDINQIDEVAQEFADRFGAPPPEVENLLYAVKIKLLASGAGIESITREDRQLVLRRFQGMRFDREQLEPYLEKLGSPLKDGITLSPTQLRLHPKRLGGEWKRVLEEVLKGVGV